ncbi:MAG: type II toxin-antitoxin system prevent-host-death family antitoxin [Acetobacteraceae bacterium]|nr:type II toxin-antitoxin system prevent-host-death family antitoxin [Acetobacteraceae bacterium]
MKVIEAADAALRLRELLETVEDGAEITITQNGTPIARLVRTEQPHESTDRLPDAIRRMKAVAFAHAPRLDARELWDGGRRF